jgi:predicted nucleotidyltransferase
MITREQAIQAVHDTARQCGAQRGILFGSHARGTATRHSDIDAVFVVETEARFIDRLGPYMEGIYERTGVPAEVLVYTPGEFRRMQQGVFLKPVLSGGVIAYEC